MYKGGYTGILPSEDGPTIQWSIDGSILVIKESNSLWIDCWKVGRNTKLALFCLGDKTPNKIIDRSRIL